MKGRQIAALLFFSITAVSVAGSIAYAQQDDTDADENGSFWRREPSGSIRDKVNALPNDAPVSIRIPIIGVGLSEAYDSWGDPRSGGRTHEGTDILAPRGTFIVSPTEAVVSRIGEGVNGGKYVYTYNPGGERFYFAHLDDYAPGLTEGQVLAPGDLIGYIGNSGNASGGPTHLHLGIYNRGAKNPYPRLTLEFSDEEILAAFDRIIGSAESPQQMAIVVFDQYEAYLHAVKTRGVVLPGLIARMIAIETLLQAGDLDLGARGQAVVALQTFLIEEAAGAAAAALAGAAATGYFGPVTQNALAEFQRAENISPATGYFGPITRASLTGRASRLALVDTATLVGAADLEQGARGATVAALQDFLIAVAAGASAIDLASVGATGYFGPLTTQALAEFQRTNGIAPASGYFGPITRSYITSQYGTKLSAD